MTANDPYKKAYERERDARILAEKLLDEKTRILYESNVELESIVERLSSTQEQLVQSEKMASIGQLAAGVAHEINNPIGFSLSNLSTLIEYTKSFKAIDQFVLNNLPSNNEQIFETEYKELRKQKDIEFISDDVNSLLNDTIKGLHRVSDIVANLKKVSHSGTLEKEPCDINEIIEDSLKVVWNELKYSMQVEKSFAQLPLVNCHQSEIHQVLMNMFINAAHACEKNGTLTLVTYIQEQNNKEYAMIVISDNGKGMSQSTVKKIFDPFYTTKPVGVGTGLGLSISFGIIEKHKGNIKVRSEEGVGTTFTISLPLYQTD